MSEQRWEPVEDGDISNFAYVDNGGKLLGIFVGDDYRDWYVTEDLPDDLRVCRLTATDMPSVPVTPEVREALEAAQQCITDFLEVYERGGSMLVMDETVKSLRGDALAKTRKALAQLEQARGGDES